MIFDHPHLSGLLGDPQTGARLSAQSALAAMLRFEQVLAEAEAAEKIIPVNAAEAIAAAIASFQPDMAALNAATARDGVVVPELVSQLRAAVGKPHAEFVHFGATSQDVVDTALALSAGAILDDFQSRIGQVLASITALEARDGAIGVFAHTRMQRAIPVTVSRKIRSWRDPLQRQAARIDQVKEEIAVLHFGGAAGTLDKLGDAGERTARRMAGTLGLRFVPHARHSERDGQVLLAGWLSLVTAGLGKMGQDIVLMAQNEIGEVGLSSGGGSSAMPHKVNPVQAETLVTLARFNATLVGGMYQAAVHENERSGAAWTLEWMLLPQMLMATAAALRTADELVGNIRFTPEGTDG